jgi:hypothetical protein
MGIYCCYISGTAYDVTLFFQRSITSNYSLVCAESFRFSICIHESVICFIENEKFLVSLIYDSLMSALPQPRKERKISASQERKFYRSCGDLLAHFGVCAQRAEPCERSNQRASAFPACIVCSSLSGYRHLIYCINSARENSNIIFTASFWTERDAFENNTMSRHCWVG